MQRHIPTVFILLLFLASCIYLCFWFINFTGNFELICDMSGQPDVDNECYLATNITESKLTAGVSLLGF